jgi:diguanylate cyclase (GGDEF)-like protein
MLNPKQLTWRLFGSVVMVMVLVFGALISSWVGMNAEERGKQAVFEAASLARDALEAQSLAAELTAAQSLYALDVLRDGPRHPDREPYLRTLAQLKEVLAGFDEPGLPDNEQALLRAARRAIDRFLRLDSEIDATIRRGSRDDKLDAIAYIVDAATAQVLHASEMVRALADLVTRRAGEASEKASVASYQARILLIAFGGSSLLLALILARVLTESMAKRSELMRRLEQLARIDSLTGVPNRRVWDDELGKGLERARRTRKRCTVGIIDLDHFKRYNDTHGHPAGDARLQEMAQLLAGQLRMGDLIARYGGEEFAVLLHDCEAVQASQLFERLHASTPDGQTFSAGIADTDGDEADRDVVRRADEALYRAKAGGRNRTEAVLSSPVSQAVAA